jgi:hypothetical protein
MVGLESTLKHKDQVLAQQVSETLVLLNPDDGEYYALDEVGGRVWELCDGARSVSEVISIISDDYDAPAETIKADVLEVLGDLADEQLLVEGN